MKHKQISLVINGKQEMIDKEIVPLVKWFNSHKGVVTTYSCMGETSREIGNEIWLPYVSFISSENFRKRFLKIVNKFFKQRKCTGYLYFVEKEHVFCDKIVQKKNESSISFHNREDMLDFYEFVKNM